MTHTRPRLTSGYLPQATTLAQRLFDTAPQTLGRGGSAPTAYTLATHLGFAPGRSTTAAPTSRNYQKEDPMGSESATSAAGRIRVAIVGVGNCAASLVQGVHFYRDADPSGTVPGLMHVKFGDYHVSDIDFVAAFDVDAKKVGRDLSEAIVASENNTIKLCDVPPLEIPVQRGHTLDGLGKYYRETIEESDEQPVDVVKVLKDNAVDVLICYLPVGSEDAARFYAQCAIDAKVAFVNALPVFIAGTPEWAQKFSDAGVAIIGDDIKSQVGATITHRVLAKLFEDRGVVLDRTYQLNVGGNMDFKNMLERDRLESKKISKTQAVTSNLKHDLGARNVHIGPSDYVQWLDDRKWAYVRLEGRAFGEVPLNLEYKLEVWDSPNSAGIIIDALRAAKIAKDRGIGGPLLSAASYFMKSPPEQYDDETARQKVQQFIDGDIER
jgi:myo-inositol-1-phosphate synthase